jgi:hypothetical protein
MRIALQQQCTTTKLSCCNKAVILSDPDPELVEGEGESKDLRLLFL